MTADWTLRGVRSVGVEGRVKVGVTRAGLAGIRPLLTALVRDGTLLAMEGNEVRGRLDSALAAVVQNDLYLLENNLAERCIAARLAMYLQERFDGFAVDVEYNRDGGDPKKLGLPAECVNKRDEAGNAFVVPDIVVHQRGAEGPNLLVLELKKTTNAGGIECDVRRVEAFRAEYGYSHGAVLLCETRSGREPDFRIAEWW